MFLFAVRPIADSAVVRETIFGRGVQRLAARGCYKGTAYYAGHRQPKGTWELKAV